MKANRLKVAVLIIAASAMVYGCSGQKAESPAAAIEKASTMGSVEKQADYLVSQANAFYKAKEYKEAVELANHVLSKLDGESQKAKDLIEKAKKDMAEAANQMAADAKKKLGL